LEEKEWLVERKGVYLIVRRNAVNLIPVMTSLDSSYNNLPVPAQGKRNEFRDGKFVIPDNPIIPFVEGDGTGPRQNTPTGM
jgi:hypothetical protein